MAKKKTFPTFAVILLIIGIIWTLTEMKIITCNIPWLPIIIIIVAVGMIFNRFSEK